MIMSISNLRSQKNMLTVALNEIKQSKRPLLLWGGGWLAKKTYVFLKANDISIDAVVVNKEYYDPNHTFCVAESNVRISILENYVMKHPGCNIFVAFAGYNKESVSKLMEYVNKVYCFDMSGLTAMNLSWMIDEKYLDLHEKDLLWLADELSDDKSKNALMDFLSQKITGIYAKEYTDNQYFDDEIIHFSDNEVFVDCGSFTGDTIVQFITNLSKSGIKKYRQIYGIEADKENCDFAMAQLAQYKNVILINKGVWDYSGICNFAHEHDDSSSSFINEDGLIKLEVQTIDSIVGKRKVTFIKMDVEGSELNALKGAERTIKRHRPKLAICIYHKPEDLYKIPQYIKMLVPEYRLYFRNHSSGGIEAVLYAV